VADVVKELQQYATNISIYDPLANPDAIKHEYNLTCHPELKACTEHADPEGRCSRREGQKFDSVVLAVAHKEFLKMDLDRLKNKNAVVYDVKKVLNEKQIPSSKISVCGL
jgi:UDP-N-acetyl-D-galactosamine dehydrogenase